MKIESVKGTRDFYPELMQKENYIFNVWRKICQKYGYEEFDGPTLEYSDLWKIKSGNEIPDQMYVFKDKGDREVAIRPELTPTLARMVALKQKSLSKPIKWFSIPRCMRYEQPQSGRLREFFQLNVDCLGSDDVFSDAENIAVAIEIMISLGFSSKDFYVRLSNRTLLEQIMTQIGVTKVSDVFRLIDKKTKISKQNFDSELSLLTSNTKLIQSFLEITNLKELNAFIIKNSLDKNSIIKESFDELSTLFNYMNSYGFSKYVQFDPTITRGFDYYTRTVFEVYDKSQKYRAIAGGGRYDNLVKDFGGEAISGVGFGMGDVVLSLFMDEKKLTKEYQKDYDYYVAIIKESDENINEQLKNYSIKISQLLREKGNCVFLDLSLKKINKALEYANKNNVPFVVIVGLNEMTNNSYLIKDMINKKEKVIKLK